MSEIPITRLMFDEEVEASLAQVLRTGWIGQGPQVAAFEEACAQVLGVAHAVAVSSGTTALHLALWVAGIKPGLEVICPSYSFVATANSIRLAGLIPRFVDVDPATFNVTASGIRGAMCERTGGILPVHQLGLPADMEEIRRIGDEAKIPVIEDAACAWGSSWRGRMAGTFGQMGCFSFHPRKVLSTGEGGMVVTEDLALADRVRSLRNHGACGLGEDMFYGETGINGRMTDLQAALGLWGICRLEGWIRERRSIAEEYSRRFRLLPGVRVPWVPEGATHNFQSYALVLDEKCPRSRDAVAERMTREGISVRKGIRPIHLEPCYQGSSGRGAFPVTEWLYDRSLFLPLFPGMTESEKHRVMESFQKAIEG